MTFEKLSFKLKNQKKPIIAVVNPMGDSIYSALKEVQELCSFLLVGDEVLIKNNIAEFNLKSASILGSENPGEDAVNAILNGDAQVLMKGKLDTSIFLKAILKRKNELLTTALLSHLLVVESKGDKLLGITDGGMNITPNLEEKVSIIQNSVNIFHNLGIIKPKVAVLAAMEMVNPAIPGAVDGALLSKMAERGQITGAIVDGPLAIDLALSRRACEIKSITGPIQGDADILIVPDINSGNILGKSLIINADLPSGGIIAGASFPIIMLSRADESREKRNSIILALASVGSN